MKKIFAILLAVMMLASMATVASAASTTLTTTVPAATYTLNIPADQEIEFGATHARIGEFTVTDAKGFAVGKDLKVTVTYGEFTAEGISTTIPYELSLYAEGYSSNYSGSYNAKNQIFASGSSFVFAGNSSGGVVKDLKIETTYVSGGDTKVVDVDYMAFNAKSADWGKALGGEYTTTITFTAEVVVEQ